MSKIMEAVSPWISVDCPLCDGGDFDTVYVNQQESGDFLGRIEVRLVVCKSCGMVLQNPQINAATLARYYNAGRHASGSVYHDVGGGSAYGIRQQERVRFFKPYLQQCADYGNLLEIGCASGEFLRSLALGEWSLNGIEPSATGSELARNAGIRVVNASLGDSDLDIGVELFDAVCLFSVLEHLSSPQQVVATVARALKTGGLFCLEVPDTLRPEPQMAEFFGYEHLWHFTRNSLERFLSRYGFGNFVYDATVADSRLRLIAFKTDKVANVVANDKTEVVAAIERYRLARTALIVSLAEKLERQVKIWKVQKRRLALYGAGVHSRFLMSAADIYRDIDVILDSDPAKRNMVFMRWFVEDESAIERGEVDAVIISSKAFEEEIYRRLLPYVASHGIELIKCYGHEE